ncbi:hypothetical protein [Micromonospora humi]|uniref:SH3 domain-containing protein n=1 Tax=Micromonospora humi TaxID=745366 RepID=A0A1C5H5C1_9ACTN|nr:hypothetical protein [Micromonospora humi]SCG40611.1 hypothetical protein GA0070213_102245 [Micromonospora humi]
MLDLTSLTLVPITAAALTVATAATPAAAAAVAPAAANCSSQQVANYDDGYAIMRIGANLKKAPEAACGTVQYVGAGTKLWLWCFTVNQYDNVWFWGRIDGTSTYGWMANANTTTYSDATSHLGWCPGEPKR